MPLNRHAAWPSLVLVSLCACGHGPIDIPETNWAVGEFSSVGVEGVASSNISRLDISEDGTARFWSIAVGAGQCGGSTSEGMEHAWEPDGDDAVIIWDHGVDSPVYLRVVSGEDCNDIEIHYIDHGVDLGSYTLHRGAMCLDSIDVGCPDGVECDSCESAWCDAPPPSCE